MSSPASANAPLMMSVSGCRGIVGRSLTPEVIARYASAAVTWARDTRKVDRPTFILARDGRQGGEAVRLMAAGALAASGCRVIDIGVATTPTAGVLVLHHKADAGLVMTASHNPSIWNGLKVISAAGGAPAPDDAKDIVARYQANTTAYRQSHEIGTLERDDNAAKFHVDRVLAAIERVVPVQSIKQRAFKVVLDSVNASGVQGGRMLLDALGCRLTHLNADASGIFPHPPEPTAENLVSLSEAVRKHSADIGFAQDPDADRLAMVDEKGSYIGEEYTLVLGVKSLLASLPREAAARTAPAANLSTSRMIDDVVAAFGAKVARTAVGEANVVAGMNSHHSLIGGEGNGGVIWPAIVPIRDSLGAMALTLALLTRDNCTLSAAVARLPAYAIVKRKIDIKEGLAARALSAVKTAYSGSGATLNDSDGVRADFPAPSGNGAAWVHVRSSNTEPIIRLIAEAPTASDANAVLDRVQKLIDAA